jgi:ABC-type lipoprotein export system ATPase subunit
MQLTINNVVPVPLRDKPGMNNSAIWNRDFKLTEPEYIFIQAPSGTGKTTLMHVLYGLRNDYTGSVNWDNNNLMNADSETMAKLRSKDISIIFQDMRLFPQLTAGENLEIKRVLTNTVSADEVTDWMERLGIKNKYNSLASTLSYGEQQRVAIIRALLQPFSWLLMDEPFSHLDHGNIEKAAALIVEVVKKNNAGLILADLEDNNYFNYNRKLSL